MFTYHMILIRLITYKIREYVPSISAMPRRQMISTQLMPKKNLIFCFTVTGVPGAKMFYWPHMQ